MESWLASQLPKVIEKNKIVIEPSESKVVYEKLAFNVYNMVYNICALVATYVTIHDPKKLTLKPRHLKSALDYVQKKCYPEVSKIATQSGGSYVIDSEYFGKASGSYNNDAGENLMDVKFGMNGIIRPEIKGGSKEKTYIEMSYLIITTSEKKDLFPNNDLIEILGKFNVAITRNSLKILKRILKMHLNCLMMDLHAESPITVKKIEKILKLSRHSVFH
jgi:hypothetical protein